MERLSLRDKGGATKGTGNTVSDYIDDIIVNGKVDSAKLNKLKNLFKIIYSV